MPPVWWHLLGGRGRQALLRIRRRPILNNGSRYKSAQASRFTPFPHQGRDESNEIEGGYYRIIGHDIFLWARLNTGSPTRSCWILSNQAARKRIHHTPLQQSILLRSHLTHHYGMPTHTCFRCTCPLPTPRYFLNVAKLS